ncbi:MAG: cyclic nucleotide-binding domain-containing protein [Dehalococcoidia bacterium]|nr:cyclic nucleotide-binding domain-containing protein [Dehalococcoidia bacterium]
MDFIEGILRMSDLFGGLSDGELKKLLPLCREEVYKAGTIIFSEGAPCHTMYIVESGKVALERNLHVGQAEESTTIDVITRGGSLCCSGLIDPYVLTATGRVLEATEVIAADNLQLKSLLEENSEIGRKTMNNLAKIVASRFQHTRETLGHVLSVVFHDFKAPLAALECQNRVILGGYAGELNEEQKSMLRSSSKRVSDLLSLVTNIMDVSRVDVKDLAISKISLAQVIMDSVEAMQPLAEEKGLQLKAEVAEELPPVYGAQERLKQVVINLLSNAIKFTPTGGMVAVKAEDGTDDIQVEIMDTGVGIPAEELPKIFDDYYRGLDLTEKGAGLGLSIAKRIIEAHQGKVWVASPCPGSNKGSQFIFTLPKDLKVVKKEL